MVNRRSYQSSSWHSQSPETSSQFTPPPRVVQRQPEAHRPATSEEIENAAFNQHQYDAFDLQLKEIHGTITPTEQARLGVLQAKMDDFWAQRMERTKALPNFSHIPIHPSPAPSTTESLTSVQAHLIQSKGDTTGDRADSSMPQRPNETGMPDALKVGVESLSGYALDDVRVHYNSPKPALLQALAYTQGTEIHVAPGQENHLPHEAWHVVQQAQGRVKPTMQMKDGVSVNDDVGLEREADVMGTKASRSSLQRQQPEKLGLSRGKFLPVQWQAVALHTIDNQSVQRLVVQRTVSESVAVNALQNILKEHKQTQWYKRNWPRGIKRIANEVARVADTDKSNLVKRLRAHSEVIPLLRPERMKPEHAKSLQTDGTARAMKLQTVYKAYERLIFYHATTSAEAVRATGSLDPNFGGNEEGYASTRSVADQRTANVAGSKRKTFVTRKFSEAKQYAADQGEKAILRVLIPVSQQAQLKVDPDSHFGLYIEEELKGLDRPSRNLNWWGLSYLQAEIKDPAVLDLYAELVEMGLFLPGVEENTVDISDFVVREEMSKEEIERRLQAL